MTGQKNAPTRRTASRSNPRARDVEPRTRVFVYGTLLAGERNHHLLEGARLVAEARTPPAFTLYDFGGFPGMVAGGNHAVPGEVYEVDEPALAAMDRLEGHPGFYQRTSIRLEDGTAVQAYVLRPDQVSHLPIIPSGSWRALQGHAAMKLVMNDDRVFQGTPLQIVRAMQDISFGPETLTVQKYIASIVDAALRFEGITLAATGTTDAELAASLIDEMVRTGLARRG